MPLFLSSRDETFQEMGDVSSDDDYQNRFRISTLLKAIKISDSVDKVTIGPNSTPVNETLPSENEAKENSCNTDVSKALSPRSGNNMNLSSKSSMTFSRKKILVENEILRKEDVWKANEQRRRDMEKTKREKQEEFAKALAMIALRREQKEAEELARLEAEEERLAEQHEIRRRHEQQLQAQRIQERKEKLEREAEERQKALEREEFVNRITVLRTYFREKCRDIGNISKACKDRNSAAVILAPLANRLKELSQQMEALNEKIRVGDISIADVNLAENVVTQSEAVLNVCITEIARIDTLYDEEIARREYEIKQQEEAQAQAEAAAAAEANNAATQQQTVQEQIPQTLESPPDQKQDVFYAQPVDQSVPPLPVTPPNETNVNSPENVASVTDPAPVETATEENDSTKSDIEAIQMYIKSQELLTNHAASYSDLSQTTTLKKFRFECQKAINIPVNAISGINGAHLQEKYETLRSLLMGNSAPNVTQHPQGVAFCMDVLAKKIVSQGETLISSKPEMAFPVAAVAVALWNDFPDFGELLLAHFRRTCPYIVPVFLPHLQGQTDVEYYKSLGYKYSEDGVVEKQDMYLTRMSGLMRLYASIIVTKQRRGVNHPHPHNLQYAWRWLATTLNAVPRTDLSDVIATLIFDLLEVAGNMMWQAYGKQFQKMLILLATEYYPRMKNEAGIGGGPMARLEQFLTECFTKNAIPAPEGELTPNFW